MKWMMLSLLNTCVYIPGLVLRYIPFAGVYSKQQKKRLFLAQGLLLLVNAVFFYTLGLRVGTDVAYGKLRLLAFGVAATGVNVLLIRERWKELLFTCGFSLLVGLCVLSTTLFAVYRIRGFHSVEDYVAGMLSFFLLFSVTFPLWRRILLKAVTPFLTIDSGKYWDTIWFIPIAMYLTCYVAMPQELEHRTLLQLISCYLILCAAVFVCLSIARAPADILLRTELERRLKVQEVYYTQLKEQVERARKSRHDFKHHIMAIREYVNRDDKEGLSLYCDRLLERGSEGVVIPYTGNSAVDGVIYHYALLAKKHQIHFDYPAVCQNPGLEDVDFCVLLGNALDNAVSGCLTVQDNRYITIMAHWEGGILRLRISNSFDGGVREEGGSLLSRKRDNRPGVGVNSMQSVCHKYGAAMDVRYDEKDFHVLFVFADKAATSV